MTDKDGLFREVVLALFDNPSLASGPNVKSQWLERLRAEGVYLIDLAPVPVNRDSPSERAAARQRNIEATVSHASELKPDGVVLVKHNVFDLLQRPILEAGLPLHDDFIPFPRSVVILITKVKTPSASPYP